MSPVYEDLFDIEKRPGAGVALWASAVERQLDRVREVNYRHRLHHSLREDEQRSDPEATYQLHADVYYLVLATRRVLLFHDALARQIEDSRLDDARKAFEIDAPGAKQLRDFYEHLDEYLLDAPKKHQTREIPGRTAPILYSRWDCDNVAVGFGAYQVDVTLAAVAAIELGKTTAAIWDEHLALYKARRSKPASPVTDDEQRLEVRIGVSTVIGGDDEQAKVRSGILLDVDVLDVAEDEAAMS